MHPLKTLVPLALAVGAVTASPAAADSGGSRTHADPAPVAHEAGGSVAAPIFPGLVNTRLVRTQKALDRAVGYADDGEIDKARTALYSARLQVKLAWRAAKHVIATAPPPPITGDAVGRVRRVARASGSGGGGGAIADQYSTAGAVLAMQHAVVQTATGVIDTARGTLRDSLSRTIFIGLDQRDGAVSYIHSIDVPPPPGDGLARASGAPVGGTWSTVMPTVGGQVGDEIDQFEGVMALSSTLGTGVRRVLKDAEFQALQTQRTINNLWPPAPADG